MYRWRRKALRALEETSSAAASYQSDLIPAHVIEAVQEKLQRAESAYRVNTIFADALEMAKYPPGFESGHPAYLVYTGPGIPAAEHVQDHLFNFTCPDCGTLDHVIVRSSEWGVNIQNGDARGQFKAVCTDCKRSFAGSFED